MDEGLIWETLKAQAETEPQPREMLERQIARTGGDADLIMRLARACIRDGKLAEALTHYDHAELLGHPDAHAERRVVAHRLAQFPDPADATSA